MPHLDKRFGWRKPRNYQLVGKLVEAGFLKHERVFFGRHGVYRLSKKGASHTDLPALKNVPLGNYAHEVNLIHVYLKLSSLYPEARFISERQLKRDKFFDGVGKTGHLSDGFLVFPDGKQVSIEVELSLKGRNRFQSILKSYSSDFSVKEVWYFCSDSIVDAVQSIVVKYPFVKVHSLQEFLE
jgi:hypothetical protein